jgi:hypothetical protein
VGLWDYSVRPARPAMTEEEMMRWIDTASYVQLLEKWRNEEVGSPWFSGEVGTHFSEAFRRLRDATPDGQRVAASKQIGWR